MPSDWVRAEAAAAHAAVMAGSAVRQRRRQSLGVLDKGHATDLVTQADLEAEELVARHLSAAYPAIPLVGEERGGLIPAEGPCWVADPLDGTANYVAGLPFYCTSVALLWDGVPVVAALYAPEQQELFTARQGEGATLNGEPIRVAADVALNRLVVAARPSLNRRLGRVDNLVACAGLTAATLGVRSLGSSALELAWVACGRFGAMYHPRLQSWDVAAGALLVSEADGWVGRPDGAALTWGGSQPVLAAAGAVQAELRAIVGAEQV